MLATTMNQNMDRGVILRAFGSYAKRMWQLRQRQGPTAMFGVNPGSMPPEPEADPKTLKARKRRPKT